MLCIRIEKDNGVIPAKFNNGLESTFLNLLQNFNI